MIPADVAARLDVSRETLARLAAFVALLRKWSKAINLVAPSTLATIWERHVLDCAQLLNHAPSGARRWADFGAGAGLPALVVAIIANETRPSLAVTAVESDRRKCAFMREAARATQTPLQIRESRIETLPPEAFDVISARALAPLTRLLALAEPFRADGAVLLLPKGRNLESELTEARKSWHMDWEAQPSVTDQTAAILKVSSYRRARPDA